MKQKPSKTEGRKERQTERQKEGIVRTQVQVLEAGQARQRRERSVHPVVLISM